MLNILLIMHVLGTAYTFITSRNYTVAVGSLIALVLYSIALLTQVPWIVYTAITLMVAGNLAGLIKAIYIKCTAVTDRASSLASATILVAVFTLIAIAFAASNIQ